MFHLVTDSLAVMMMMMMLLMMMMAVMTITMMMIMSIHGFTVSLLTMKLVSFIMPSN